MVRLSTVAVSTLVPALKVRSTTLPESTFFSVVRTKAPPLPGLTCWNCTTDHSWPSRSSTSPFFRSLVVATPGFSACFRVDGDWLEDREVLGRQRQQLRLGALADDERVLDADAAAPGKVDPRLDGDGHPVRQCTGAQRAEGRRLVDLQPDPVAEPVPELLGPAGPGDDVPGGRVDGPHVGADPQRRPPG